MKITIHHCSFEVSEPYASGPHILTLDEAKILNNTRAERIYDILRARARRSGLSLNGNIPTHSQWEEIQAQVTEIDQQYQSFPFQNRRPEAALDTEIAIVASERILQRLRSSNADPLTKEESDKLMRLESALPEVYEEARRRLLIKQQAVGSLEDIL